MNLGACLAALKDSGLSTRQIDEVVLVGGMIRMPAVQERVRVDLWQRAPRDEPDDVAVGAAIQGAVLKGEVKDVLWI